MRSFAFRSVALVGLMFLAPTVTPSGEACAEKCCKICTKGKACGDSCIAAGETCTKGAGCACNG